MAKKSLAMKIENVSMKFNLSSEKVDNIKEYVIKMIKKELMFQEFWALRDISFEVQKGDRVGIMGLNGAGKSTLLKVISGVLKATQGTVTTNGKIAPLLLPGVLQQMAASHPVTLIPVIRYLSPPLYVVHG